MVKRLLNSLLRRLGPDREYVKEVYSLEGEDLLIYTYLWEDQSRFYIDVGAHHPFKYSNTAYLYNKGWRGINIEPTPTLYDQLVKHRSRDINVQMGVAQKEGRLKFYEFDNPAFNSFDEKISKQRIQDGVCKLQKESVIEIMPLEKIIDQYLPGQQQISFMNVDVEGLDLEVLKSNNWDKYRPRLILVEDFGSLENLQEVEIYHFLRSVGYKLVAKTSMTWFFMEA